ncbi:MAG: hypothetical protein ACRYF2_13815, partial [Janthinobacterium lividum]
PSIHPSIHPYRGSSMTLLRYDTNVEQPPANEQANIDGIIKGTMEQSQTVKRREHYALRAS